MTLDYTHDAAATSWVVSANGHRDFPIQNLPVGIFSAANEPPRPGMAIGDSILDLTHMEEAGALPSEVEAVLCGETLNGFLAAGADIRRALRHAVFAALKQGAMPHPEWLHDATACTMHLPARIGDYTDFYAGIHHAEKIGRLFRPDAPLLPNYKHVPIAYHGRASSVCVSGTPIHRPNGQRRGENGPAFGPCAALDFELELGVWIGPGNLCGTPIPIAEAHEHIAGYCLLNDWSARDIQAWEYQPLGPFLAKNFATTVSPWIVTPEALEPFRIAQAARPVGDPAPLPYLLDDADQRSGGLDIALTVEVGAPECGLAKIAQSSTRYLYWTVAQMVAHHTSGGCNLQPGDLFGSGTISGPAEQESGSLMELTRNGQSPLHLANGMERRFLQDGDEVILTARTERDGYVPIGFGPCSGRVALL